MTCASRHLTSFVWRSRHNGDTVRPSFKMRLTYLGRTLLVWALSQFCRRHKTADKTRSCERTFRLQASCISEDNSHLCLCLVDHWQEVGSFHSQVGLGILKVTLKTLNTSNVEPHDALQSSTSNNNWTSQITPRNAARVQSNKNNLFRSTTQVPVPRCA